MDDEAMTHENSDSQAARPMATQDKVSARRRLIKALRTLKGKVQSNPWKKHDNIPL
jgi:acetyl-CoA carboxylase carboxyltransferase component